MAKRPGCDRVPAFPRLDFASSTDDYRSLLYNGGGDANDEVRRSSVNDENPNRDVLGASDASNPLWQYVQNLSPEAIAHLSRPQSDDVLNVMERNIVGLLGTLSPEHFDVQIETNREQLGRLLASALMSGYFLRNAEQRLYFEQSWHGAENSTLD